MTVRQPSGNPTNVLQMGRSGKLRGTARGRTSDPKGGSETGSRASPEEEILPPCSHRRLQVNEIIAPLLIVKRLVGDLVVSSRGGVGGRGWMGVQG